VRAVLDDVKDVVDQVEVGHAINRVKWGIWTLDEYKRMWRHTGELRDRYPDVVFMGPAVIDFEYHYLAAALDAIPEGQHFDALSHHLYVDRRGAPEQAQGGFSALEKFALARALARTSPACGDRLVISEVNWPLADGGVYSPIGAPYLYPGQTLKAPPSVSEEDYADYMVRYLLMALCSGLVERVYWWRLVHRGFGLIDDGHDWRKRPAYDMLRVFLELLGPSTFVARKDPTEKTTLFLFDHPDQGRITVAYAPGGDAVLEPDFTFLRMVDAMGHPVDSPGKGLTLTGRPLYLIGGP
jgi:hypothetical protein